MTEILRAPVSRLPARQGELYLIGRTKVPEEDACYHPRWHLVRWKRRPPWPHPFYGMMPPHGPRTGPWVFCVEPRVKTEYGELAWTVVERWWAYAPRCGGGKGCPALELTYGMPTCKRCLRHVHSKTPGDPGSSRRRPQQAERRRR